MVRLHICPMLPYTVLSYLYTELYAILGIASSIVNLSVSELHAPGTRRVQSTHGIFSGFYFYRLCLFSGPF